MAADDDEGEGEGRRRAAKALDKKSTADFLADLDHRTRPTKCLGLFSTLMPNTAWRKVWDVVQCPVLLYVSMSVPIRIGFSIDAKGGWYAFDMLIDLYFWTDIVLNFVTGYENNDGETILNGRLIAINYLKSWFAIDLLASLPIDFSIKMAEGTFACTLRDDCDGSGGLNENATFFKLFRILRLTRLMKLLRLARVGRILEKYQDELFVVDGVIAIFKFVGVLLFLGHLFGCFFYFFSTEQYRAKFEKRITEDGFLDPWILAEFGAEWDRMHVPECVGQAECLACPLSSTFDPEKGDCINAYGFKDRYIASLYWAFTTMTTVGYGDIKATTNSERIAAVVGMILGGVVFSAIIGNMTATMSRRNLNQVAYRKKLDSVSLFLREATLPKRIRDKVLVFFRKMQITSYDTRKILNQLPFELRVSVVQKIYRGIIEAIPFMNDENEMLISDVCVRMVQSIVTSGIFIYQRGENSGDLYIVYRGEVEMFQDVMDDTGPNGEPNDKLAARMLASTGTLRKKESDEINREDLQIYKEGAYFGESGVMQVVMQNKRIDEIERTETVRARQGGCTLLMLSLSDLIEITHTYPIVMDKLVLIYKRKYDKRQMKREQTTANQQNNGTSRDGRAGMQDDAPSRGALSQHASSEFLQSVESESLSIRANEQILKDVERVISTPVESLEGDGMRTPTTKWAITGKNLARELTTIDEESKPYRPDVMSSLVRDGNDPYAKADIVLGAAILIQSKWRAVKANKGSRFKNKRSFAAASKLVRNSARLVGLGSPKAARTEVSPDRSTQVRRNEGHSEADFDTDEGKILLATGDVFDHKTNGFLSSAKVMTEDVRSMSREVEEIRAALRDMSKTLVDELVLLKENLIVRQNSALDESANLPT